MGCSSSKHVDQFVPIDEMVYINHLKTKFPSVNTVESLKIYSKFIKNSLIDVRIKDGMISKNYIDDNDMLTTGVNPFNVFARFGACVMPNIVDQSILKEYKDSFVICHNKPENDENWNVETFTAASMAGPDSNGPGHVFITTKNLHWSYFNVLTIVLEGRYEFLLKMKRAALLYTESRGWKNPGFFFHVFPHNSVQSLHLHIIDMDNLGFQFEKNAYKNLSIDDAIIVASHNMFQS
jgi:hypothetical protein